MESRAFRSKSVGNISPHPEHFSLKMKREIKRRKLAVSPVLDQGYDLRVGLSDDALSVHLHYPIPCAELQQKNFIPFVYF